MIFRFRFQRRVLSFIQQNPDPAKVVGVHCTHGVNRTGYLICRCGEWRMVHWAPERGPDAGGIGSALAAVDAGGSRMVSRFGLMLP